MICYLQPYLLFARLQSSCEQLRSLRAIRCRPVSSFALYVLYVVETRSVTTVQLVVRLARF